MKDSDKLGHRPRWYRWYVLATLMVIYAFSFVDRQIIGVLAPFIKRDLGITDAQIGLLFGTSFALFYGLFGIGLAKLADGWSRVNTLAIGLCIWSVMTTLSGATSTFAHLGLARIGVGVGEASSSPAAVSLLSDYFVKERRSTVFALYSTGIYIGAGASLILGGAIVAAWENAYPVALFAPFGLHGWQAAFIAIGLPGILFALIVKLTVIEPPRADEAVGQGARAAFREAGLDIASMIPGANLLVMRAFGMRARDAMLNLAGLLAAVICAVLLVRATDRMMGPERVSTVGRIAGIGITSNTVQWSCFTYTIYAAISWIQILKVRDPLTRAVIIGSRSFVALAVAAGLVNCVITALNSFVFIFGTRYLGLAAEDGIVIGAIGAVSGASGMIIGGLLGDMARRAHPAGRIYLIMFSFTVFSLAYLVQYSVQSTTNFLILYGVGTFAIGMWQGPIIATVQDIVLPNIRGLAFAVLTLGPNVLGLGLGPYLVGMMSDASGSLRFAVLMMVWTLPTALGLFWYAGRHLPGEESGLAERVRQAAGR